MEFETTKKNYLKISAGKTVVFTVVFLILLGIGFLGGILFENSRPDDSSNKLLKLINLDDKKPESVDFGLFWNK